jgi:1A family penicillin-binding protein
VLDRVVPQRVPWRHHWLRHFHHRLGRWAVPLWIAVGACFIVTADALFGTPSAGQIRELLDMSRATTLYDVRGEQAFVLFKERRLEVPLAQVSPLAVRAVLAIEDQRFYRHYGLDPWRIGGAIMANLRHRRLSQGGSTITQQLVRKSFLSDQKSLRRKLKEAVLAFRIERAFTKDQILELYLNKVYFGNGLYGIEAAARGYFDKSASALTLEEAALLAGLIQAPSAYDPTDHPERAVARRKVVLAQMVEAGFIDEPAAKTAGDQALHLTDGFRDSVRGPYFKNYVTRLLVDRFGWATVSEGGLRVFTTYDPAMQQAAEAAVQAGIADVERRSRPSRPARGGASAPAPPPLQGALVALDAATGEIRALVGGRDFESSQFDRATQARRQAGSAFKPFVYAAALEKGYSPATLLTGLDDPMLAGDESWLPDDGHSDAAAMTMRTALRTSSNRAAVQVLRAVGVPEAVSYAHQLGLEAPPVPALVLGAGDVTLLSLTAAYGTFANGGWLRQPSAIRRVEDRNGRVLFADRPASSHVVSEETSYLMAQMLTDVVDRGTGYRVRQAGFRQPAAGKTGTTNDYHDAWFVGFTPAIVAGVWIGFDEPRSIMRNGYAGDVAAPIWGRFMRDATGNREIQWLRRPGGIVAVEICKLSGALPTEGCRRALAFGKDGALAERSYVGVEYFRRGTEPEETCPIHGLTHTIDGVVPVGNDEKPRSGGGFWRRLGGALRRIGGARD